MMVMFITGIEMVLDNIVIKTRFGMGVGSMTNKMDIVTIMKMDI